ncbi:MAG: S-layer homology domain-containing protein [Acutalibacteraceae bacterium]
MARRAFRTLTWRRRTRRISPGRRTAASSRATTTGPSGPKKTLTREQMAVMLARYYARSGVTTQGSLDFADAAKISGWAVDGVSVCVGLSLVQGDPRGRFLPQSRLTRAQIASILVRMAG